MNNSTNSSTGLDATPTVLLGLAQYQQYLIGRQASHFPLPGGVPWALPFLSQLTVLLQQLPGSPSRLRYAMQQSEQQQRVSGALHQMQEICTSEICSKKKEETLHQDMSCVKDVCTKGIVQIRGTPWGTPRGWYCVAMPRLHTFISSGVPCLHSTLLSVGHTYNVYCARIVLVRAQARARHAYTVCDGSM